MAGYDTDDIRALIALARASCASPDTSLSGAAGNVTPNIDGETLNGSGSGPSTIDEAAQVWLQAFVNKLALEIFTDGDQYMTASTMNGKSIQIARRMTKGDLMRCGQRALAWLQSGFVGPTQEVYGRAF